MSKRIEIKSGDTYGRLTIVKEIEPHITPSGSKKRKVLCNCSCGNETKTRLSYLRMGDTKSCGCLHKEGNNSVHGLSNHPLYGIWEDIKQRCYNTKRASYKNYGGRGITVCPQWLEDFMNFYTWAKDKYQKGLEIDRIDNDLDYSPDNCRFVTSRENQLNRRLMKNNTSGYRGVSFYKTNNKWRAYVSINNKLYHIGYYKTSLEAALAYNEYIIVNKLPNKLNVIKEN